MENEKISVVVPVFNAGKYLKKCIESILSQSYANIELILVNDCSTDMSLQLCEQYARKDNRVQVINKPQNAGVELARIDGIKKASGAYIGFVDADDFLAPNALQHLHQAIKEQRADIVIGKAVRFFDKFLIKKELIGNYSIDVETDHQKLRTLVAQRLLSGDILFGSLCAKLYRRELFSRIDLQTFHLHWQEDALLNLQLVGGLTKIIIIPEIVYFYRYGGVTNRFNNEFLNNIEKLYRAKVAFSNKLGIPELKHQIQLETYQLLVAHLRNFVRFKTSAYPGFNNELKKIKGSELFSQLIHKEHITELLSKNLYAYDQIILRDYILLLTENKLSTLHLKLVKENQSQKLKNFAKMLYTRLLS